MMLNDMKKDVYELVSLTKGIFLNDAYPEEYKINHKDDIFFSVKPVGRSIDDINTLPYVRVSNILYPLLKKHWDICEPILLSFSEDFKDSNITIYRVENAIIP